ncbi:MAG: hypothetical protein L3J09_01800 [Flavobacteriaceae bacterium]|nr:hypothetical protein [Flavobacteriaceae bacterium]
MKKISKLITIVAITLSITSCGNTSEKKESKKETIEETKVVDKTEAEQHDSDEELTLNDGKRWEANPETTQGVKQLQMQLQGFSDKESVEAYATLTKELEETFAEIFAKCTMKGEAHNQLHNFLKPMLDLFDGMKSGDLNNCKKSYDILNKHLTLYKEYFI